jgi:diguanylate cyclase (GGDEF)-like protein/PAS domain S-box-containing protein
MHADDLAGVRSVQAAIVAEGGREGPATARFRTADAEWRWMSDHGRAIKDADGQVIGGIDSLRDIQTEHDALEALAQREQELRGVVDTLLDPWVLLAAVRDDAGRIVDFEYVDANDAACEFNGTPRDELIGMRLLTLLPEHGPSGIFDRYARAVETGIQVVDDDEPFTSPLDGRVHRFDNRGVRVGDGLSLTWRDVTERYEARRQLALLADHDILTGVANRRQLDRRMEELFARAPRTGTRLAVLYCDIDHFKDINDTLGHAAGDEVLSAVARAIRLAVRDGNLVARLGGDEFVSDLDGVRGDVDAESVASKIAVTAAEPLSIAGLVVEPRLSIGIAVSGRGEDPHHAMERADAALYEAKRLGRNRVVVDHSA